MGKKSRRNKKNNGGPLRKRLDAVPPTAATAAANIFKAVTRLMQALKYDEIFKVESKYRHLDTFSDDPNHNLLILYAFASANYTNSAAEDEICMDRAIHYYERAKERIDANDYDHRQASVTLKAEIGTHLAALKGRDMEKAISSHRWSLENCVRHEDSAMSYVILLSSNFNRFEKFEYAIEVLKGAMAMDMIETVEEEVEVETYLIEA